MSRPHTCFMNRVGGCKELVAMWTVGSNGVCYHENAGIKFGKTGFKKVLFQVCQLAILVIHTVKNTSAS